MLSFYKEISTFRLTIFLVCLMTAALAGCNNSLDPLDEEKGIYSIFGFVDINRDTNFIRVKNLNIPNIKDSLGSINAAVTLTNLESNTTQILQDSVVIFNGVVTHNFKTSIDILPLTIYRVKVEKKDGRAVTATATTPNNTHVTVKPINQNCGTPITYRFEPVHPETYIEMRVYVTGLIPGGSRTSYFDQILLPDQVVNFDGVLSFTITPHDMLVNIYCETADLCPPPLPAAPRDNGPGACYLLESDTLRVKYFHYGPNYKGDGGIITDTLEIDGATGRFFGVGIDEYSFTIDTSKL